MLSLLLSLRIGLSWSASVIKCRELIKDSPEILTDNRHCLPRMVFPIWRQFTFLKFVVAIMVRKFFLICVVWKKNAKGGFFFIWKKEEMKFPVTCYRRQKSTRPFPCCKQSWLITLKHFFFRLDFVTSMYVFGDPRKNAVMNLDAFQTNWKEHSKFLPWYPVLADEESRKQKQHILNPLLPGSHQFLSADLPCQVKFIGPIVASGHVRQTTTTKTWGAGNSDSVGCL